MNDLIVWCVVTRIDGATHVESIWSTFELAEDAVAVARVVFPMFTHYTEPWTVDDPPAYHKTTPG